MNAPLLSDQGRVTTSSQDVSDLENNLVSEGQWKDLPDSPTSRVTVSHLLTETKSESFPSIPDALRSASVPTDRRSLENTDSNSFSRFFSDMSMSFKRISLKRPASVRLFNCLICLENHALSEAYTVPGCVANHQFCKESVSMLLTTQINDGVLEVRCPCFGVDACSAAFGAQDIRDLVDDDCYKKYIRFTEMKSNPHLRECPKCSLASDQGSESCTEIVCAGCSEVFCYLHSNAHPTMTCVAYAKVLAKSEMKSMRQIKVSTRKCPQCRVDTEKSGGCNHMSCQACRADWCWLCGNLISSDHYDYSNFLSGCAGQQFAEESVCCRFASFQLLFGRTCGGRLERCLTLLMYVPFLLVAAALTLAFMPVSSVFVLMFMVTHGCDDEDFFSIIGWIFLATPLFCPLGAIALAVQVAYLPFAFLIFFCHYLYILVVELSGGADGEMLCKSDFWFWPMMLFGALVYSFLLDDD